LNASRQHAYQSCEALRAGTDSVLWLEDLDELECRSLAAHEFRSVGADHDVYNAAVAANGRAAYLAEAYSGDDELRQGVEEVTETS